ncbi:CENP-B N-terminal DNA-binding domain [Popillia japonica]|uniref:CENP-B N-terminal DNA-binding domain n=1 Tax=Popillia japonica TaxID=7064 RepID=A0AAW1IBV7_POPJA
MKEAIEKVRLYEMSIREANERYCVPKSTLADRCKVVAEGKEVEANERYCVPKSTLADRCKVVAEGKEVEIKPCLGNVKAFPRSFNDKQEDNL